MAEKTNPYIAGAPVVEKSMFFGREGVFDWIENSLTGKYVDHILVLHGQRRVGKTSVLKHIPNRLPDKYIPIFIDLQGRVSTSLGRFLGWLAREISRALQSQGIEIPRPDRNAFEEDPDYFETIFLPQVKQTLGDRTILLTLDEFDTFESTDAQESLAVPFMAILKRLMDHHYLSFVFSIGSSGRKLENMQAAYTSFFKQALYRKISFLEPNDAHDLIVKPVADVVDYSYDAIERIIKVTSAHPYFIQLVCHELFSECQKKDVWSVSKQDVDDVLEPVVERGTVNLKFVWDEASDLEKWVLASLASTKQAMSITEIEATLTNEQVRFTRQQLEIALLHLREKDVLFEDNRFVIYLLRMWLERNRPMEQVREELEEVNPIVSRLLEIGQEYHDKGEYDRAIQSFEEALSAEGENLEAHLWLGNSQLARGDYGKAIAEFETVLEIKIDDVVAQKGFCDAYMAMGDESKADGKLEEAEYAYQQVLGINPQHRETLHRMAELHHRRAVNAITGSHEVAMRELETALNYAEEDGFKTAYHELKAFIAGDRKQGEMLLTWAQQAQEMKLWDEAGKLLDAYRRESGDEQTVSAAIAEIRSQIDQQRQDTLSQRANRLTSLARYDDAIDTWNRYLLVAPEQSAEVRQKVAELQEKTKADAKKEHGIYPAIRSLVIAVVVVLVVVIGYLLAQPTSPLMVALAEPTSTPTLTMAPTPSLTPTPTPTTEPTATPTLAPTVIPLRWERINSALFLTRDEITAIAVHPTDEDILFAGTAQSGVYKSINGGETWTPSQIGLGGGHISTLLIDPKNPNILYVSILNGGLAKSINGGENWKFINNGIDLGNFWRETSSLTMDPEDPAHLFFASGYDIYETIDAGETWERIFDELANGLDCTINYKIAYGLQSGELYKFYAPYGSCPLMKSTDNGRTWKPTYDGMEIVYSAWGTILANPIRNEIYFGYSNKIAVSSDDGENWVRTGPEFCYAINIGTDGKAYCSSDEMNSIYSSDDGWQTYKKISISGLNKVNTIFVAPKNSDMIVVGGNSIFKSMDGGTTWEEISKGIGNAPNQIINNPITSTIYIEEQADQFFCGFGSPSSLFRLDLISNQAKLIDQSGCGISISEDGTRDYRFKLQGTSLLISTNGGETFSPSGLTGNSFAYAGKFTYNGREVLYASEEINNQDLAFLIHLSYDYGKNWETLPSETVFFGNLFADPYQENVLWGVIPNEYLSTDGGNTWDQCGEIQWLPNSASMIAPIPEKKNAAFLTTYNQGLRIIDCGQNSGQGTQVENGLDNLFPNSVVVDHHDPHKVYVGSNGGFYISFNGGTTWNQVNDGLLGALTIYSLTVDPNNPGVVYASTPYGIFQLIDN